MAPRRQSMMRRIGAFAGIPLLSALVPFFLLPFIARIGGADAWTSLGMGQSIGSIAAIIAACGWTLVGPAMVSSAPQGPERTRLLAVSVVTRSFMTLGCAVPLAAVAWVVTPGHGKDLAVWMAIAQMVSSLSPAWYCIAVGDARRIVVYDVMPRMVALTGVTPFLLLAGPLVLYPLALLLSALGGTLAYSLRHNSRADFKGLMRPRVILGELARLRAAMGSTLAAGAYASTPVLVVGTLASIASAATFVSADRLYKIGLMAITALGNSLQGWVAERGADRARRIAFSVLCHFALGLGGLAVFAALGPWLSAVTFGDAVAADWGTCVWLGVATLLVSINTSLGAHGLVPLGRVRVVFRSTIAGAVIGLPLMAYLAYVFGAAGCAAGLAIGELVVAVMQAWALARLAGGVRSAVGKFQKLGRAV